MISKTLKKLRYRSDMHVGVLHAPVGFEVELKAAEEITRAGTLKRNLDLVQAFYTRRSQLEREIDRIASSIGATTILWICYPKAKKLSTDLNRDVIRSIADAAGLTAVAIVAIDDVWSALRLKA